MHVTLPVGTDVIGLSTGPGGAGGLDGGELGGGELDVGELDAGELDVGELGAGALGAGELGAGVVGAGAGDDGSGAGLIGPCTVPDLLTTECQALMDARSVSSVAGTAVRLVTSPNSARLLFR